MACDIPTDFEKQWDMADIVLHTEDSDGKELHANKTGLALFSPYFRALFFHDFKEKDDDTVTLNCGFGTMKEILKIIHQVDFDYSSKGHLQYEAPMLVDLYRAADIYDFPTVRKLCSDQMNERPSVQMAKAAMDLGLHDLLMGILGKLRREDVIEFTTLKNVTYMFSKKNILFLFKKLSRTSFEEVSAVRKPLVIERPLVKTPQFDLTKPWEKSNVVILTGLSGALFGQLETIEMVARNFAKHLKPADVEVQLLGIKHMAKVDVEYTTMIEILSVIHHCDVDCKLLPEMEYTRDISLDSSERTLSPILLPFSNSDRYNVF